MSAMFVGEIFCDFFNLYIAVPIKLIIRSFIINSTVNVDLKFKILHNKNNNKKNQFFFSTKIFYFSQKRASKYETWINPWHVICFFLLIQGLPLEMIGIKIFGEILLLEDSYYVSN